VGLIASLDAVEQRKSKACGENPYWIKMILNLQFGNLLATRPLQIKKLSPSPGLMHEMKMVISPSSKAFVFCKWHLFWS